MSMLKKYKLHALTPNDESRSNYYQSRKWNFEDYRAACLSSSGQINIGGGHAADKQ